MMDPFLAKVYFYFSLCYERHGTRDIFFASPFFVIKVEDWRGYEIDNISAIVG